ncbi:MAG: chromosomal replication initiator protein DnaA [Peptococcaceae bacterium]|jgi:chromosomal replication initiator protein|nr:chromosomal replication initiator protein DnaA [Peptococcaceae bacterium]
MSNIWQKAQTIIRQQIPEDRYERWFRSILSVTRQKNQFIIAMPTEVARDWMEENMSHIVKNALCTVSGEELDPLFISFHQNENQWEETPSPTDFTGGESNSFSNHFAQPKEEEEEIQTDSFISAGNNYKLNPRYTFDTFVVGNSNRFAHAAAHAVAERPARAYNPLFIYGGSGLGKTHLMQAIAYYLIQHNPGFNVVFVSTETFTNEFIASVRLGKAHSFKNRYRNADALLVDDIQFISGKESTQEEFFHTFNSLFESGKQIILSSDRPPKDIPTLEERLRSRFEMGLITDIQPPDVETRIAILQYKAQRENIIVSDEVLFFIASRIHSNIRELEGALNKVIYYAHINCLNTITPAIAGEALKGLLPDEPKKPVTIDTIQEVVADYYHLKVEDFKNKRRDRAIAYPRQIAMYLCRDILEEPLQKVGQEFGGRDHTTVLHAYEKISAEKVTDENLNRAINELIDLINK